MPNKSLCSAELRATLVNVRDSDHRVTPPKSPFRLSAGAETPREGLEDARRLQSELANAFSPRETEAPSPGARPDGAPRRRAGETGRRRRRGAERPEQTRSRLEDHGGGCSGGRLRLASALGAAHSLQRRGGRQCEGDRAPRPDRRRGHGGAVALEQLVRRDPDAAYSGSKTRRPTAPGSTISTASAAGLVDQQTNVAIDLERARADKAQIETGCTGSSRAPVQLRGAYRRREGSARRGEDARQRHDPAGSRLRQNSTKPATRRAPSFSAPGWRRRTRRTPNPPRRRSSARPRSNSTR